MRGFCQLPISWLARLLPSEVVATQGFAVVITIPAACLRAGSRRVREWVETGSAQYTGTLKDTIQVRLSMQARSNTRARAETKPAALHVPLSFVGVRGQ
jgi:hypothetical protein